MTPLQHSKTSRTPNLSKICPGNCFWGFQCTWVKPGRFGRFFVLCFLALGGRCLQMLCLPGFGTHANTQNLPHFRACPASNQEQCPPKCLFFMANAKLPNRPGFALLQGSNQGDWNVSKVCQKLKNDNCWIDFGKFLTNSSPPDFERGEKTPTPKISALLGKRPALLRTNFVLTKDRKRPYYRHFCGEIHREGSCSKAAGGP